MLKEGLAPVTAHTIGVQKVLLGIEMGGNERKDIQRNAVDGNEGVPPLANVCQRCRNVLIELRDVVEGKAAEGVNPRPREWI